MRDDTRQRRYGFTLLTAALGVAAMAAVAAPAVASAAAASAPARIIPDTLLPGSVRLSGVYCTKTSNCWAVGIKESAQNAVLNQIVHWNGKQWAAVSAPSPGGTKMGNLSDLSAVRCPSATNCWAVGRYDGAKAERPQALHWNGKKWGQAPAPSPSGTGAGDFTFLSDVTCTSTSSCWAVGGYGIFTVGAGVGHNLAIHWNGKKWSKANTPDPAGTKANDSNSLAAVRCASANDCWAAGSAGVRTISGTQLNEMLHWNGRKWSTAKVPSPGGFKTGAVSEIEGLACTSASNCWAVGDYGPSSMVSLNQALHWNGRKWSQVTTPNPDGTASGDSNSLTSVNCGAANDCWAVGDIGSVSAGGATTAEALHWKGIKWRLVKTPNPGGTASGSQTELASVRCVSTKDCWAVGFSRKDPNPDLRLTLHWNNVKWSSK